MHKNYQHPPLLDADKSGPHGSALSFFRNARNRAGLSPTKRETDPSISGLVAGDAIWSPFKALLTPRVPLLHLGKPSSHPSLRSVGFLPPPRVATPLRAFYDRKNAIGELATSSSNSSCPRFSFWCTAALARRAPARPANGAAAGFCSGQPPAFSAPDHFCTVRSEIYDQEYKIPLRGTIC